MFANGSLLIARFQYISFKQFMSARGERAGVERAAHSLSVSLDARFPCPRSWTRSRTEWLPPIHVYFSSSVFVIFLLLAFSNVDSDGLFSFVIKKYVDKMEKRGITEVGKGVSKDISVTVKQDFNWLIIFVFCKSSTRNKNAKNFFYWVIKYCSGFHTQGICWNILKPIQIKISYSYRVDYYLWRWIRWRNAFWLPVRRDWGIWPGKPWDTCTGINQPLSFKKWRQKKRNDVYKK